MHNYTHTVELHKWCLCCCHTAFCNPRNSPRHSAIAKANGEASYEKKCRGNSIRYVLNLQTTASVRFLPYINHFNNVNFITYNLLLITTILLKTFSFSNIKLLKIMSNAVIYAHCNIRLTKRPYVLYFNYNFGRECRRVPNYIAEGI